MSTVHVGAAGFAWFALALSCLSVDIGRGEQAPQVQAGATRRISGRVVSRDGGGAISGATIRLIGERGGLPLLTVRSDGEGRFTLSDLSPGRFQLTALAAGYVEGGYGQASFQDPKQLVDVTETLHVAALEIRLTRTGTITGIVRDDLGDPVVNATVAIAQRRAYVSTARYQHRLGVNTRTDDTGAYRFANLQPGAYIVVVPAEPIRQAVPTGLPTTFHPSGESVSSASAVMVEAGRVVTGVDVHLQQPGQRRRVSGMVRALAPRAEPYTIELIPESAYTSGLDLDVRRSSLDPMGRFMFDGIPPGQYRLRFLALPRNGPALVSALSVAVPARGLLPTPEGPTHWAETLVTVADQDLTGLTLPPALGARFSGRIQFEGGHAPPTGAELAMVPVVVLPADGRSLGSVPHGRIEPSGEFRTVGFPPGLYELAVERLMTGPLAHWKVRSVRIGGREMAGLPVALDSNDIDGVEIIATDSPATISGIVRDRRGAPAPHAAVHIIAADPAHWLRLDWASSRLLRVVSLEDGRFSAPVLPGEYFVVSAALPVPDDWRSEETLRSLTTGATRIRVEVGQRQQADVVRKDLGGL